MLKRQILFILILFASLIVAPAMADDIDIYGTTGVSLEPNVLIILDNSGSMTRDSGMPGEEYAPDTDYASPGGDNKERHAVYYRACVTSECGGQTCTWTKVTDHVDNIKCDIVRNTLNASGWVSDKAFNIDSLECGGNTPSLRTGNFINYEEGGYSDDNQPRYVIAKRVISRLIAKTDNVRFGLMHFNSNNEGGYIKYPCGTDRDLLADYVSDMQSGDFRTNTPLAETLAEAGLYFSGKTSWYTSNSYSTTEPVQEVCQKNYIILMTDGEPTSDLNNKLWTNEYIVSGKYIGRYAKVNSSADDPDDDDEFHPDADGYWTADSNGYIKTATTATPDTNRLSLSNTNDFLDDVSEFLYDNDIHESGDGSSYEKQNIITHTIGFSDGANAQLLYDTAQKGGGDYYYANSLSGLEAAFQQIINSISESNAVFAAPVVPVNRVKRTYGGEWIYLAYFRPQQTGEWLGNIKKYLLGNGKKLTLPNGQSFTPEEGGLYDIYGNDIEEEGIIKDNACSFWTTICNDGNDVSKGGVGEKLNSQNARNLYYYKTGENADKRLWLTQNHFKLDNEVPLPDSVILKTHTLSNEWKMGAIIHSEPALVHYSNTQTIIFAGVNDGMLHCFNETNGEELWGFIPPAQLSRLAGLSDSNRDYYVDGSPIVSYGALMSNNQLFEPEVLIFGERRGGYRYYALDISDYSQPEYLYSIEPNILGAGKALGQTWCVPKICTISTGSKTIGGKEIVDKDKLKKVFLLTGGYDTNQDSLTPNDIDSLGKSVFSVMVSDGSLSVPDINHTNFSEMKNCIVDVKPVASYTDSYGNEITARIYAGDMGGKMFVFADDIDFETNNDKTKVIQRAPDGTFPLKKILFDTEGRKIFHAPGVAGREKSSDEWVVFGTGDKEHPSFVPEQGHENRFYAIKNDWVSTTLKAEDLIDLTTNTIDLSKVPTTEEAKEAAEAFRQELNSKAGWFIKLSNPGEKTTSSPVVSNGYIYFTTYTPDTANEAGATPSDPCAGAGAIGTGRIYALQLNDAVAIYDYNNDGNFDPDERGKTTKTPPPPPKEAGGDVIVWPEVMKIPPKINYDYYFWRKN